MANYNDGTVSILINGGVAVFFSGTIVTVGGHPEGIVVGDFDNDGDADVAVSKDDLAPIMCPFSRTISAHSTSPQVLRPEPGLCRWPQAILMATEPGSCDEQL